MANTPINADTIGERVARLETNMAAVMTANVSREAFQNTVLEALTTIKLRQEDSLNYQRVCDAERDAHEKRISSTENIVDQHQMKLTTQAIDLAKLKTDVQELLDSRKVVISVTVILSGICGYVMNLIATFLHHP